MFTGLISCLGQLKVLEPSSSIEHANEKDLEIEVSDLAASWLDDVNKGDSIAVDGVCLTVTSYDESSFKAVLSEETVSKTLLGKGKTSGLVNLEKAMSLNDRLGGHLVSGHVDTVTTLENLMPVKESHELFFSLPKQGANLIAPKGSITINGISLTVNQVTSTSFSVMIIPHTWQETNLSQVSMGQMVHLEFDMIARYVARLLEPSQSQKTTTTEKQWTDLLKKL